MMKGRKENIEAKRVAHKYASIVCVICSIIIFLLLRELYYESIDRKGDLLVFTGIVIFTVLVFLLGYITIYTKLYTELMYYFFKEKYLSKSKFIAVIPVYDEILSSLSKEIKVYATCENFEIIIYIKFQNEDEYYEWKRYNIKDFYEEFYIIV